MERTFDTKHNECLEVDSNHVEEYVDLVDQNDCVVQTMARSEVYQKNLCSMLRSVWLIIKNEQGQLWIPRRSLTMDRLPGYLDGSVSGHVRSGESYEQALFRETQEEAGIDLSAYGVISLLGKLTPHEHNAFCFAVVYELTLPDAPQNWNRDDIAEWYWFTPEELRRQFTQGDKFKDMLPIILEQFYKK